MVMVCPSTSSTSSNAGIAVISFDFSVTFSCANTSLDDVPSALTMWMAAVDVAVFMLLRKVFPSIAMTSANPVCNDCDHPIKHSRNFFGSSAAHTRANVFLHGMPDVKGKYSRKKSSLSSPNVTRSRQLSEPHIEPHNITNKISTNGYNFDRSTRGSVNTIK